MRLERIGPAVFQLTIHGYELSTLVAAARWAAEGGSGELSPEAHQQLVDVIKNYDAESERLREDDG